MMSLVFVFTFIAKQQMFIVMMLDNDITKDARFKKYAFLHNFLVIFPNILYMQKHYCCWFKIVVIS